MRSLSIGLLAGLSLSGASAMAQQPASPVPDAGLTLELHYSPRAAAELARLGEGVTVAAYYGGEPRPAHRRQAADDGTIALGEERFDVPDGVTRVTVTGRNFQAARRGWVVEPRVNINVFSARRANPDNILNCSLVEGSLAEMAGRTHQVHCSLIGE